jgi:hypothetical protein
MKFSPYITGLLRQKSQKDFRMSGDCEFLALDIESVTGEHIGVNTLKRLLGFIDDEREPRTETAKSVQYSYNRLLPMPALQPKRKSMTSSCVLASILRIMENITPMGSTTSSMPWMATY